MPRTSFNVHRAVLGALALVCALLSGCTVLVVGGAAVGVAVTAGSLAVDAGVGAVKLTGKAVGAVADAVLPGSE